MVTFMRVSAAVQFYAASPPEDDLARPNKEAYVSILSSRMTAITMTPVMRFHHTTRSKALQFRDSIPVAAAVPRFPLRLM